MKVPLARLRRVIPLARLRYRPLGVRARLILLGTTGLAIGLGVGFLILIAVLNHVILRSVAQDARDTGNEVARLIEAGEAPQPLPVSGGQYVQVVDSHHRVVAVSSNADRLIPLLREREILRAAGGQVLVVDGSRAGLAGLLRVVTVQAETSRGLQTVIVARPMSDVNTGVDLLGRVLLGFYPLMVILLAIVGWRVAGAALRPVEALRLGAERITGAATTERLPVPASGDEIHRLAVTLNDMLDRLASARERQRAFVADAAHELRSPLASMRVQLEVAARLEDHGGLTEDLLLDVDRLSQLVDDLLILARGDERLAPERVQLIDLDALVRDVVARYATARVPVRVDSPGSCWIRGDVGELVRVVINLIDNAVRHARRQVTVTVTEARPNQLLAVTDDGPGIPEADRNRVFERFTRLDDARGRDDGGTGLGLAIVRGILRRHGGEVALGDTIAGLPNSGLRAEVRLPRADPTEE
ncbi:MAG: HAMP domain-containing histidine kinase [Micromonosporaceae bacterium]|nr:HAMP domain-containing histidine kinase [Micromonosporaceae bacterium]